MLTIYRSDMKDEEIVIDLNLPIGIEAIELYQKRMKIVYDVADSLPDYCSIIIMDHGLVVRTIESRRKRQEDIFEAVEYIKEKFKEYFEKNEN